MSSDALCENICDATGKAFDDCQMRCLLVRNRDLSESIQCNYARHKATWHLVRVRGKEKPGSLLHLPAGPTN